MASKEIKIRINAKTRVKMAIHRANMAFVGLQKTASRISAGIAAGFRKMRGGLIALAAGAAVAAVAIKKAFEFESFTVQFKVLFGNLEKAKQRIADLQKFSAETPFQFGEIAQASRSLEVFTGGVLGAEDSLRLVGDAAAATGQNIKDVSFWVGRAYSAISSGRPFGEAAMRLQEMGILSGAARGKIEDLTKAGATNAEIWGTLQGEMEGFEGGMMEMSTTGDGLVSTLKDNWTLALAEFGKAFVDIAKKDISTLIAWLKRLKDDGTITKWADTTVAAMRKVGAAISKTGRFFKEFGGFVGELLDPGSTAAKQAKALEEGIKSIEVEAAKPDVKIEETTKKDLNTRIADDMAKKQITANKKIAAKLQKTREKIEKDIAKKVSDEQIKQLKSKIAGIDKEIAATRPDAERGVRGFIDKFKADEAAAKEAQAFDEKVAKLREKEGRRGLTLSKKDSDFLAAVKKAEDAQKAAQDKIAGLEAKKQQAADVLKKLNEDRNKSLKDMQSDLNKVEKKISSLLQMK